MIGLPGEPRPAEVIFLRTLGLGYLALFLVITFVTEPKPSLEGEGLAVLLAFAALVAGVALTSPSREVSQRRRVAGLLVSAASSAALAALQPAGLWEASPYFIAIVAAARLDRRTGIWVVGISLLALAAVAGVSDDWNTALSVTVSAIPWFLIVRLMRAFREQNTELQRSRAAAAAAAADAERARLAREMHDVLAHSLSALALQLESARLTARKHGAEPELVTALDRAHHSAVAGLDETRRAMGALRGEELPGPERVPALAEAFEQQAGLPVSVSIQGEPRQLAPDARLALYRTVQEALTNVRRHATPASVDLLLDYRADATVLVVADHASEPVPALATGRDVNGGYGLTGMRERAELLGGELVAGPTDDGFRVELRLPA
jgi:signal transduction histidine kinase